MKNQNSFDNSSSHPRLFVPDLQAVYGDVEQDSLLVLAGRLHRLLQLLTIRTRAKKCLDFSLR